MLNVKEVLEGWRNHLIPPEDLKELIHQVSNERQLICALCPKQSTNAKLVGYKSIRKDVHCTACGCPLVAKTKSLSSKCPLDPPRWDAVTTAAEKEKIEKSINNETKS